MYKCIACGNTEKFIGSACEQGKALITSASGKGAVLDYNWMYILSEGAYQSRMQVQRCFYCHSKKIVQTEA